MLTCVGAERSTVPPSAKVPPPADTSRVVPEPRRRLGEYKLESKQSPPTPVIMSNELDSISDLSGYHHGNPHSSSSISCSEMPPAAAPSFTTPTEMEGLSQVKVEERTSNSGLGRSNPDGLGDSMDCIQEASDIFNYLGGGDDVKINFSNLGLDNAFEPGLPELSHNPMEDLSCVEPFGMGVDMSMEMRMDSDIPVTQLDTTCHSEQEMADPVALGIPYYVACQWEQVQQQQLQHQQAAAMLWWQAYICGAYGMGGGAAPGPQGMGFPAQQLGWSMAPQIATEPPSIVPDGFFPHMAGAAGVSPSNPDAKAGGSGVAASKRRRRQEPVGTSGCGPDASTTSGNNKKGRRPKQEERVCKNCGTRSTPFWRKNKQDGLPLCNACGLYLAKNDAPRPKVLWKSGTDDQINDSCLGHQEQLAAHDHMDIDMDPGRLEQEFPGASQTASIIPRASATHC